MTADAALDLVSWALLLSGGFFAVTGGIGMIRLPDFYTRLHASSITDTGAAYLILAGLMIQGGLTIITIKLVLIGVFMFFSNPVSTYALAAAAHRSGIEPLSGAEGAAASKSGAEGAAASKSGAEGAAASKSGAEAAAASKPGAFGPTEPEPDPDAEPTEQEGAPPSQP